MSENFKLWMYCNEWSDGLEKCGYICESEKDDDASMITIYSSYIPFIGSRLDLDGYPFRDGYLKDLSDKDKKYLTEQFSGSYRVKDVCFYSELYFQEYSENPDRMSRTAELILEKISKKIINNSIIKKPKPSKNRK